MRLLSLLVITVLALQTVYSQVQRKDISVCDNAEKKYGVGFNPHPFDCSQFVQCFYYGERGRVEPVYRNCEYGQFWDQSKLSCLPAKNVDCPHDECKVPGKKFFKYSDPNKCNAYWKCVNGKTYGQCCPEGYGFHPVQGCIVMPTCTDMCPFKDRVPGCPRRPMSGAPTKFEQYTDNGIWRRENCPAGCAYNPADCDCSLRDIIVPGRQCKPDVQMNFDNGLIEDVSGNNYRIYTEGVSVFRGAAYFRGNTRLAIEPLRPSIKDEGVLIIKLRFRENNRRQAGGDDGGEDRGRFGGRGRGRFGPGRGRFGPGRGRGLGRGRGRAFGRNRRQAPLRNRGRPGGRRDGRDFEKGKRHVSRLQALVTNGHCGRDASVVIAKLPNAILLGAEANMSRSFPLPIVNKPWKEVIYIKDEYKLEGRVCGASYNDWCVGKVKDTNCGLQIGAAPGLGGFVGLIDDISIYRCKPLDAVVNINY